MADVYPIFQQRLGQNDVDWVTATIKIRPITDAVAPVFDEADLDMTAVMANSDTSAISAITGSPGNDATLGTRTVDIVTTAGGGSDYAAVKTTYSAVSGTETWTHAVVYDAQVDTNDGTRIPICLLDLTDVTANGSDIDILFSGTDPGEVMTSRTP